MDRVLLRRGTATHGKAALAESQCYAALGAPLLPNPSNRRDQSVLDEHRHSVGPQIGPERIAGRAGPKLPAVPFDDRSRGIGIQTDE